MDDQPPVSHREIIETLMSSRIHWREMKRRFTAIDDLVTSIVSTPLFQHTYTQFASPLLESMIYDARSGAGLIANNLLSPAETTVFVEMGLVYHLNLGMALAARRLRFRLNTIPPHLFIAHARLEAFATVLAMIGKDLKDPRPIFQEIIERLPVSDEEKMSILNASMANLYNNTPISLH